MKRMSCLYSQWILCPHFHLLLCSPVSQNFFPQAIGGRGGEKKILFISWTVGEGSSNIFQMGKLNIISHCKDDEFQQGFSMLLYFRGYSWVVLRLTKILYDKFISLFNKCEIPLKNRIQICLGTYFCFAQCNLGSGTF